MRGECSRVALSFLLARNFAGKFLVDKKGNILPVNQATVEKDIQNLLAQ
jgi:hypothetical protein